MKKERAGKRSKGGQNSVDRPTVEPSKVAHERCQKEDTAFDLSIIKAARPIARIWLRDAERRKMMRADPRVNPVLYAEAHVAAATALSFGKRDEAYEAFTNTPEYQAADEIERMTLDGRFDSAWNKAHPNYLREAQKRHSLAREIGRKAMELYQREKIERIKLILRGGDYRTDEDLPVRALNSENELQRLINEQENYNSDATAQVNVSDDESAHDLPSSQFLENIGVARANDVTRGFIESHKKFIEAARLEALRLDQSTYTDGDEDLPPANIRPYLDSSELLVEKNVQLINDLFLRFNPLIRKASRSALALVQLPASLFDDGELSEVGRVGIMSAIVKFDGQSSFQFLAFAEKTAKGFMLDYLRSLDPIPRELREAAARFEAHGFIGIKLDDESRSVELTKVQFTEIKSLFSTEKPLAQKEAVLRIVKTVLAERYREDVDMKTVLYGENHYGRRIHDSPELSRIRQLLKLGFEQGFIEFKGARPVGEDFSHYSNSILHYWLNHDRRLMGGARPTQSKSVKLLKEYHRLKSSDPLLAELEKMLQNNENPSQLLTFLRSKIRRRCMQLFMKAHGIDLKSLPTEIAEELEIAEEDLSKAG